MPLKNFFGPCLLLVAGVFGGSNGLVDDIQTPVAHVPLSAETVGDENVIEVDEHQRKVLNIDMEVSEGETVISRFWQVDPDVQYEVFGSEMDGKYVPSTRFAFWAAPRKEPYPIRVMATIAKHQTREITIDGETVEVITGVTYRQAQFSWLVKVKGKIPKKPDPKDPEDEEEEETDEVTQVTYVYEKERAPVPNSIRLGLRRVQREGITAGEIDQDARTGDGNVPSQYKIAIDAAKEAGIPALVVQAGDKIVKVIQNPQDFNEVLEAIK